MKNPFLLIPTFPDHETVNSLLERVAGYNYGGTLRAECVRLLRRARPLLDTIPCSVHRFCEVFDGMCGDAAEVLHRHTLFDFFACGVTPDAVANFKARLINNSRGPLRPSRLPLFFDRSENEVLHCVECDERNRRIHGFAFIYRQHSAPLVDVCPWHGVPLRVRPGGLKCYDNRCRLSSHGQPSEIAEFSLRTARCIETSWKQSAYRRHELLRQLVEKQWISERGRCAESAFLLAFNKRFNKSFRDERLRLLCSEHRYSAAALRALLRSDRNIHPTWCVLFKWFADEAENSSAKRKRGPGKIRTIAKMVSEHELTLLRASKSIRQASATLNASIQTLLRVARQHAIPFKARPKKIFENDAHGITNALREGLSASEVAAAYKVSLSTVYRLLANNGEPQLRPRELQTKRRLESARGNWLAALKKHPNCTVTELRHTHSADWGYLYRHDRAWLRQHSPSRPGQKQRKQATPPFLLTTAVNSLIEAAEKCGLAEDIPIRRSTYRLGAMSGLSEYQLSKLMSAPGQLQLGLSCEAQSSFVARRLRWVVATKPNAAYVSTWRLAKNAGLRVGSVRPVVCFECGLQAVAASDEEGRCLKYHHITIFSSLSQAF
jgi:transposase